MPTTKSSSPNDKDKNWSHLYLIISTLVGITAILTFILDLPTKFVDALNVFKVTGTPTVVADQPILLKFTPVPRINKILEINFSPGDRGICVTDDTKMGGNDISQNDYFVIGTKNGYITYCNITHLVNKGSLEITADPHGSPDYFGYGVIFGFIGGKQRDLCSFEIIKDFSQTKVVFGEYIDDYFRPSISQNIGYKLDANPHTIRMVLYPDGNAIGYIDEIPIAEHKFIRCSEGRVGFVAYGQGDDKISFDDLKLFALP